MDSTSNNNSNRILSFLRIRPQNVNGTTPSSSSSFSPCIVPDDNDHSLVYLFPPSSSSNISSLSSSSSQSSSSSSFPPSSSSVTPPRCFSFDYVFPSSSPQFSLWENIGKYLLQDALKGINSACIAYGQTSSGKTFTISGVESNMNIGLGENYGVGGESTIPSHFGLIPRILLALFSPSSYSSSNIIPQVSVSYVELYNDNIYDLLSIGEMNSKLDIKTVGDNFVIDNLSEKIISNAQCALMEYHRGNQRRRVAQTKMNCHSSRSHAIFTINVFLADGRSSTMRIVDLAGSENAKAANTIGGIHEGNAINKALLSLGVIIQKLVEDGGKTGAANFIPWRTSKLTMILKDCLGGNSKTRIVATVSADVKCYSESIQSIQFAQKAIKVITQSRVNDFHSKQNGAGHWWNNQMGIQQNIFDTLNMEQKKAIYEASMRKGNQQNSNQSNVVGTIHHSESEMSVTSSVSSSSPSPSLFFHAISSLINTQMSHIHFFNSILQNSEADEKQDNEEEIKANNMENEDREMEMHHDVDHSHRNHKITKLNEIEIPTNSSFESLENILLREKQSNGKQKEKSNPTSPSATENETRRKGNENLIDTQKDENKEISLDEMVQMPPLPSIAHPKSFHLRTRTLSISSSSSSSSSSDYSSHSRLKISNENFNISTQIPSGNGEKEKETEGNKPNNNIPILSTSHSSPSISPSPSSSISDSPSVSPSSSISSIQKLLDSQIKSQSSGAQRQQEILPLPSSSPSPSASPFPLSVQTEEKDKSTEPRTSNSHSFSIQISPIQSHSTDKLQNRLNLSVQKDISISLSPSSASSSSVISLNETFPFSSSNTNIPISTNAVVQYDYDLHNSQSQRQSTIQSGQGQGQGASMGNILIAIDTQQSSRSSLLVDGNMKVVGASELALNQGEIANEIDKENLQPNPHATTSSSEMVNDNVNDKVISFDYSTMKGPLAIHMLNRSSSTSVSMAMPMEKE